SRKRTGNADRSRVESPLAPVDGSLLHVLRQGLSPRAERGADHAGGDCPAGGRCAEEVTVGTVRAKEGIMIDRRTFMSFLATAAVAPRSSFAQGTPGRVALYSSIGPVLTHYDVDVEAAALTKRASVPLPANVQYAWPHASRRFLYVASSSIAPGTGPAGSDHYVCAIRI